MSEYRQTKARFCVGNDFRFLTPALDNLSPDIRDQLVEVIYSWRDGVESVCVVTESLDCLKTMLNGNVPSEISKAKMTPPRYFVDLESIGTDNLRLYIDDSQRMDISIVGFKFDSNGNLTERKDYWRDKEGVLIDRYDASNNLISSKEPEIMVTKDDFLGSSEIADKVEQIANERRYDLVWMNKVNTKQSYIRIRRPHVMLGAHIEHLRKNHGFTET
tara:strand:+ start:1095 stop:1745 length:651 start_codon:yes stop_codon:yes gene_type:complete